jgi:hypothetical protein
MHTLFSESLANLWSDQHLRYFSPIEKLPLDSRFGTSSIASTSNINYLNAMFTAAFGGKQ